MKFFGEKVDVTFKFYILSTDYSVYKVFVHVHTYIHMVCIHTRYIMFMKISKDIPIMIIDYEFEIVLPLLFVIRDNTKGHDFCVLSNEST